MVSGRLVRSVLLCQQRLRKDAFSWKTSDFVRKAAIYISSPMSVQFILLSCPSTSLNGSAVSSICVRAVPLSSERA